MKSPERAGSCVTEDGCIVNICLAAFLQLDFSIFGHLAISSNKLDKLNTELFKLTKLYRYYTSIPWKSGNWLLKTTKLSYTLFITRIYQFAIHYNLDSFKSVWLLYFFPANHQSCKLYKSYKSCLWNTSPHGITPISILINCVGNSHS